MTATTNTPEVARFIERMKRERIAAGLPATIVDGPTLRLIAALVSASRPTEKVAA